MRNPSCSHLANNISLLFVLPRPSTLIALVVCSNSTTTTAGDRRGEPLHSRTVLGPAETLRLSLDDHTYLQDVLPTAYLGRRALGHAHYVRGLKVGQ